ncbi:unnamed protein product [Alternaria alternata]
MRLTQAAVVAILAFTAAATPIAVRGDDAKATEEYQRCCEQRDKYDHSKICIPPKVEVPHVPEPIGDGKEHGDKDEHDDGSYKPNKPQPDPPVKPEEDKDEHDDGGYKPHPPKPQPEHPPPKPEHPTPPKPQPEYPAPQPEKEEDDKPHPAPQPKPVPEADQHGYYTFGEEISLKCEGGKIVVKGHKY